MTAIMFQGTGSNVGKSMMVAGLCRHWKNQGLKVAPFKPQNMSNNAAVTMEGGEIGRAQALQALACGLEPSIHMNPVLLKPESNTGSQVVVQGKAIGQMKARDYASHKKSLLSAVMASYDHLKADADIVVIEGAGSASEVNLRAGDIANMGFAEAAKLPVILIGDIDRGGVIASLVGTRHILPAADRALVRGYVINKFRGDPTLFTSGLDIITSETDWPSFGVLPWFDHAAKLPAEDSEDLSRDAKGTHEDGSLKIVVPVLPRIANFDDLDALRSDPSISVEMIRSGRPLPLDADLVILPGSKSTIADFEAMKREGWDIDIKAHARKGGHVLGLCGGYQMLGRYIHDPQGVEGPAGSKCEGLGLLDIETVMDGEKRTVRIEGTHIESQSPMHGYEIHIGSSDGPDSSRPLFEIEGQSEGARSPNGRIMGSYIHGLFNQDTFRGQFFKSLGHQTSAHSYDAMVDETLDLLADHVANNLDTDGLLAIAQGGL
ncbi:adenosylcobyric acid synthase (glutamine-hydrolysing) [Cohaesibacter sp. ES.047]|uniref:cobyric acid synthase n=1 Tax=Cohaesibacter sp. ES.047 TaxID=1798205 RepID=UPI000BB9117C|nr:cobyric acid synthase [Cohaesibacter sp. ES.047]SNY93284.1 adenosylcobyric acid synthase (glutamine-hydrolysing) [Cohaesibacter sp. ES.047]